MMTEEPVRASNQQNQPSNEKTLDLNDKKFKGPKRSLSRRKRYSRENEFIDFNQPKMMNDDRVFYRSAQDKSPPLPMQYQVSHQQQQSFQQLQLQPFHYQTQQLQTQPLSPQITPPLSTSHPLSSFRTPSSSNPHINVNQFMMGQKQFPISMPMPMQLPIPMPMPMPMPVPMTMPINYNGAQVPVQMPLQIPLNMAMSMPQGPMQIPNFPLPVFIRMPFPLTTEHMNYFNENFKQQCEINGSSEIPDQMADAGPICVPNYMPQMFAPQVGPFLFGLPQSMMYSRPELESPFHVAQPSAK